MIIDKSLFKKYFKPRSFEVSGRSSIYKKIGIGFFKKYLPTSGDWVNRRWGSPMIKINSDQPFLPLYQYELITRKHELRHWIGMLFFIALAFVFDQYRWFDYLLVGLLFLIINVYPILLQRHNRIRILQVLHRHNKASPYEKSFSNPADADC